MIQALIFKFQTLPAQIMPTLRLLHFYGALLVLRAYAIHARTASASLGSTGTNGAPPRRQHQENGVVPTKATDFLREPFVAPPPPLLGEPTPSVAVLYKKGSTAVVPWGAIVRALSTTTVPVSDQATLVANLNSDTTINLGGDIALTSDGTDDTHGASDDGIIIDNGQTNLVIDGMGLFKVDGQGVVRCFYISGDGVDVVLQNLEITNGYVPVTR